MEPMVKCKNSLFSVLVGKTTGKFIGGFVRFSSRVAEKSLHGFSGIKKLRELVTQSNLLRRGKEIRNMS
ncbi:Uncharacterised protein [Mycobacteroides abscessus subsp. abscessus]|nr:Uncharacterised protein [Mycobacteroides abscessus subsp. abscessus]